MKSLDGSIGRLKKKIPQGAAEPVLSTVWWPNATLQSLTAVGEVGGDIEDLR